MTTVDKRLESYILYPALAVDIFAGVVIISYILLLMWVRVGTLTPGIDAAGNAIIPILQLLFSSVFFLLGFSVWFVLSVIYGLLVKGMVSP